MMPMSELSNAPIPGAFVYKQRHRREELLIAYERGGLALGDAVAGLNVQDWTARYDGDTVILSAPSVPEGVEVFQWGGITEIDIAFDQSMRPFLAFVDSEGAHIRWYDTQINDYVISDLPDDVRTPRCTLDDNRPESLDTSDIILAYTRGRGLYYRQQRDRYQIERMLVDDCGGSLVTVGMNAKWRLQFQILPRDW